MFYPKYDYSLNTDVTYGRNGSSVAAGHSGSVVIEHSHNIPSVMFPSYEFRVVEWEDDTGKIVKVGLQCREFQHSPNTGSPEDYHPIWTDVPRIRLKI
jgi:hypothetical protein